MKRPSALLLPVLLVLAGVLASCLLPPFDRGLSLAQVTASKMKLEAHIGPLYRWRGDVERGWYGFLPGKTFGPDRGFLVSFGASAGRVFYVHRDELANFYYIAGEEVFGLKNSESNRFNYGAFVLKDDSGSSDALLLVRPTLTLEQRMEYWFTSGFGLNGQSQNLDVPPQWISTGTLAGIGMFYDNTALSDFLALLVFDGSAYRERLSDYRFESPTHTPSWTDGSPFAIPGSPAQGFYFRNPSGLRFLSVWNGSKFVNYRWDDGLSAASLPFDGRIEALLSTDELLVVDEDAAIVYSPAGQREYFFPLGSLRFAYETYRDGTPTLLFSLVYWNQAAGSDDEFYINVYSLPTARLSTLD